MCNVQEQITQKLWIKHINEIYNFLNSPQNKGMYRGHFKGKYVSSSSGETKSVWIYTKSKHCTEYLLLHNMVQVVGNWEK